MFNSKSFDLNNEDFSRQPENLYQPRKIRWLKYIIQPAAIIFVILLIIWNVDFSNDQPQVKSYLLLAELNTSKAILPQAKINWSALTTTETNLTHLDSGPKHVNNKTHFHNHNLLICHENNYMPGSIIKSDAFNRKYRLQSLNLRNFTLVHIIDDTSNQNSLHNLINLELINHRLKLITTKAFRGPNKLCNITLINRSTSLRCKGLMTLLANTICSAKIDLQYTNSTIYKPEYKMEIKSFKKIPALVLIPANCRCTFDVSKADIGGLLYLDLSVNILKELSNPFLLTLVQKDTMLNHVDNNWDCSFTTFDLLKYLEIKPGIETVQKSRNLIDTDVSDDSDTSSSTTIATTTTIANTTTIATTTTTKADTTTKQQAPARTTTTIVTTTRSPANINTTPSTSITETTPTTETIPITETTSTPQTTEWDITETTESIKDDSPLFGHIICINTAQETISNRSVKYNARIKIVDDSNTEVDVILSQLDSVFWSLIYFSNVTYTGQIDKNDTVQILGEATVRVKYLTCDTSYVFCLMLEENMTSPFNCLSHQTMACSIVQRWFDAHSSLIVSVAIVGILLCITFGLFAVYGVLWLRPTWLWGSKRLIRPEQESHKMILLPRSYEKDVYDAIGFPSSEGNINEYVTYYRRLEQATLNRGEPNNYNIPPLERAPSVPLSGGKSISSTNPYPYTYECFELYEELS